MTQPMTSTTCSPDVVANLTLIEVKPGVKFSLGQLRTLLPDLKTALFFGKVYNLDFRQLSLVLSQVLNSDVAHALLGEAGVHSSELQDYVVDMLNFVPSMDEGDVTFDPEVPIGEILPELWADLEVEVADSIKAVAEKLESVVGALPGKQGQMLFKSMAVLNAKRPTIGDYRANIHHAPQKQNLLILDVSGSMNSTTVRTIVDDVVALSYKANAHFAIVSDEATYLTPGSYSVSDVLAAATYGGTHYEQLAPLMDMSWGTVITVADYDSSQSAKNVIARCSGAIDEVVDVSLVARPTFLAECVGQLAAKVRPMLVASPQARLCSSWNWY